MSDLFGQPSIFPATKPAAWPASNPLSTYPASAADPIVAPARAAVLRPEQGGGRQAQHALRRLEEAQGAPRLPRQLQVRPDLLGGRWGGDGVQPAAGPLPPAGGSAVALSTAVVLLVPCVRVCGSVPACFPFLSCVSSVNIMSFSFDDWPVLVWFFFPWHAPAARRQLEKRRLGTRHASARDVEPS